MSLRTAAPPTAVVDEAIDPALRRLATAIVVGAITVILDTTIISVGIHQLGLSLHASVSTIQWVSTGYLLAMFLTIPLSGWAQSRLGSKRLWLIGLSTFLLGSALCAAAWNAPSLIAFRAIQGVGGGVMMPLMTTILMQAAGGRNLGTLMATVSLPAALGPILGPVLGGLIINELSWQWMFLVNLPIGAIGLYLAVRRFPAAEPSRPVPLDVVGFLLISPGVVAVIYGLSQFGGTGGLGRAEAYGPLLIGLALVTAFALWAGRRGERALIDVRLLRHRALSTSALLLFLSGIALYGAMLVLPLYWQEVRGEDALGAGLLLIPQGIGALGSRSLAGRLTDSIGGRMVAVAGFVVLTLATIPFAFAGATTSTPLLMVVLLVRGFGLGAVTIPLMTGAYVGLRREEMPDASIVMRIGQQLGGSVGVAVLATILASASAGAATPSGLAHGFDTAFWWTTALSAVAIPMSFLLPRPTAPSTART